MEQYWYNKTEILINGKFISVGELFGVVLAISVNPYASTHASHGKKSSESYVGMYSKECRYLR